MHCWILHVTKPNRGTRVVPLLATSRPLNTVILKCSNTPTEPHLSPELDVECILLPEDPLLRLNVHGSDGGMMGDLLCHYTVATLLVHHFISLAQKRVEWFAVPVCVWGCVCEGVCVCVCVCACVENLLSQQLAHKCTRKAITYTWSIANILYTENADLKESSKTVSPHQLLNCKQLQIIFWCVWALFSLLVTWQH